MSSTPAQQSTGNILPINLQEAAPVIATTVAAEHADAVHDYGRFPTEAVDALREARLLGALVPTSLGGEGATITAMVGATSELAQECANTAMVFAMHQIQVAMLVRHGDTAEIQKFLGELAGKQLLIANAFSEVGPGGDARRSECAMSRTATGYVIEKQASVCSYALYADAVLVSARRDDAAQPEDQAFVLSRPPELVLEPLGEWDAIGPAGYRQSSVQDDRRRTGRLRVAGFGQRRAQRHGRGREQPAPGRCLAGHRRSGGPTGTRLPASQERLGPGQSRAAAAG
jgi:alkylation response protein AidB-like acyl-CoA dehydrogenase